MGTDGTQPLLSDAVDGSINSSYRTNSRKNLLNVVQLGLSFCLLFIAFNTAQVSCRLTGSIFSHIKYHKINLIN
jgi:hypothetical protein